MDLEGQEESTSKEERLAAQLKEVDEDLVIIAFNDTLLRRKCLASSEHYDESIDLSALIEAIFRPNEWWATRDLMYEALKKCGLVQGFTPKILSNTFRCNRSGEKEYKRTNYSAGKLQVGCPFLFQGLHGASMSEQNNSSVLCNLNEGHVKNNTYCESRT